MDVKGRGLINHGVKGSGYIEEIYLGGVFSHYICLQWQYRETANVGRQRRDDIQQKAWAEFEPRPLR